MTNLRFVARLIYKTDILEFDEVYFWDTMPEEVSGEPLPLNSPNEF